MCTEIGRLFVDRLSDRPKSKSTVLSLSKDAKSLSLLAQREIAARREARLSGHGRGEAVVKPCGDGISMPRKKRDNWRYNGRVRSIDSEVSDMTVEAALEAQALVRPPGRRMFTGTHDRSRNQRKRDSEGALAVALDDERLGREISTLAVARARAELRKTCSAPPLSMVLVSIAGSWKYGVLVGASAVDGKCDVVICSGEFVSVTARSLSIEADESSDDESLGDDSPAAARDAANRLIPPLRTTSGLGVGTPITCLFDEQRYDAELIGWSMITGEESVLYLVSGTFGTGLYYDRDGIEEVDPAAYVDYAHISRSRPASARARIRVAQEVRENASFDAFSPKSYRIRSRGDIEIPLRSVDKMQVIELVDELERAGYTKNDFDGRMWPNKSELKRLVNDARQHSLVGEV